MVAAPQRERAESEHDRLASEPNSCAEDMEEEKNPVKIDHGVNYPARSPGISRGESIRELRLTRVGVYGFRLARCVVGGAHECDAVHSAT
jgi:hypothetical protein